MSRFAAGILLHFGHAVKDTNKSLRFGGGGKLGKGLTLKFELVVAGRMIKTILDLVLEYCEVIFWKIVMS